MTLKHVTDFNFLGTVFDENLNWSLHTQKIANKVSRTVGLLSRLKRTLPQNTLRLIYTSLVLPHLQYGILNWGFNLGRIYKLQKRAVDNFGQVWGQSSKTVTRFKILFHEFMAPG